ncbi:MAG: hypothetical protein HYV63_22740, partial [Candidatus Schekmanbacteria bacterium]|nr:hypothetical protein [Candidatus Schekmanbacteria bacterium]
DTTAPSAGAVGDGLGADVDYQTSTSTIQASWAGFSDSQSGVAKYEWAIGTTAGGTDVQGYTDVSLATDASNAGLSLSSGAKYYVTIRATNGVGMTTVSSSDGVTVDTTAPTAGVVRDGLEVDRDTQGSTTTIEATWFDFSDPESGISGHEWSIGTTPGGAQVQGFVAVGLLTSAYNDSLDLVKGTTYYVSVRASNGLGMASTAISDGVTIDISIPTPTVTSTPIPTYTLAPTVTNTSTPTRTPSGFRVLLVDDDDNAPDVRSFYVSALDSLGIQYYVWDTNNSDNEPLVSDLSSYAMVIWFTGSEWDGSAGPGVLGESALAGFLDAGGKCLYISSQDYRYNRGQTVFMETYLGVGSGSSDDGDYTSVSAEAGPFSSLGTVALSYPFEDYSDVVSPGSSGSLAFSGSNGKDAAVFVENDTFKTTYWGFPFEALSTANDRQKAIDAAWTWCSVGLDPTRTPTPSATLTVIASPSTSPTSVATQTLVPAVSPTQTATHPATATPTESPTFSPSPAASPTHAYASPSPSPSPSSTEVPHPGEAPIGGAAGVALLLALMGAVASALRRAGTP